MCNCCANNGARKGDGRRINVMSRRDPTKTTTLRRRFEAELNKRWRKARGEIRAYIDRLDYPLSAQDQRRLSERVEEIVQREVLDGLSIEDMEDRLVVPSWVASKIDAAREKGAEHAITLAEGAGIAVAATGASILGRSAARNRRAAQIEQVAEDMSSAARDTRRSIRREAAAAATKTEAMGAASERARKTGQHRMRLLARTEVVRAHHKASMSVYEYADVDEVSVVAEIRTAGDDRVCVKCKELEDQGPMPLKEAENLIPLHVQCRCRVAPVPKNEDKQ